MGGLFDPPARSLIRRTANPFIVADVPSRGGRPLLPSILLAASDSGPTERRARPSFRDGAELLQKKAPNALNSLDASQKPPPSCLSARRPPRPPAAASRTAAASPASLPDAVEDERAGEIQERRDRDPRRRDRTETSRQHAVGGMKFKASPEAVPISTAIHDVATGISRGPHRAFAQSDPFRMAQINRPSPTGVTGCAACAAIPSVRRRRGADHEAAQRRNSEYSDQCRLTHFHDPFPRRHAAK
jgi:hypothetical protein